MEGDAGTNSRLNPPPMPTNRRLRRRNRTFKADVQEAEAVADETTAASSPEVTTEDSPESEGGAEPTASAVTTEDSPESEGGAEPTEAVATEDSPESEGGAEPTEAVAESGTEPTEPVAESGAESTEEGADEASTEEAEAAAPVGAEGVARRPSRLGRGWKASIAVALVLCAGGIAFGGYRALVSHREAQAVARADAAALKAAVDCVAATQAPDTNAMAASERKIIDCGTDAFRSQALLYTGMIVQAYQAANVHVQVADVRAAVERNNSDGSVDVLVALRVKVDSAQQQNETGYRLRVKMALAEGQYRISKLDQVTK